MPFHHCPQRRRSVRHVLASCSHVCPLPARRDLNLTDVRVWVLECHGVGVEVKGSFWEFMKGKPPSLPQETLGPTSSCRCSRAFRWGAAPLCPRPGSPAEVRVPCGPETGEAAWEEARRGGAGRGGAQVLVAGERLREPRAFRSRQAGAGPGAPRGSGPDDWAAAPAGRRGPSDAQ